MNFSYCRKLSTINDGIQEENMNIIEKSIYQYLTGLNIEVMTDPTIKEEDHFNLAKERIWLSRSDSTNSSP